MSVRVYYADSNPAVDRFAYRQSNARAKDLVNTSQGRYITLEDGRTAIQLFRHQPMREVWNAPADTPSRGCGMGVLKFVLPESSKEIHRSSLITNVRAFATLA